jgi:hypothetical protein
VTIFRRANRDVTKKIFLPGRSKSMHGGVRAE